MFISFFSVSCPSTLSRQTYILFQCRFRSYTAYILNNLLSFNVCFIDFGLICVLCLALIWVKKRCQHLKAYALVKGILLNRLNASLAIKMFFFYFFYLCQTRNTSRISFPWFAVDFKMNQQLHSIAFLLSVVKPALNPFPHFERGLFPCRK